MQISDLLDTNVLSRHLSEKTVGTQVHPEESLLIYNYTPRCQFSGEWDAVSEQCRGLIVDQSTGEVVSRPFRKFFNYETITRPETHTGNLPVNPPVVTRKYDGSLGVGYRINGAMKVATRGSFTSDQALWATKWIASVEHQNWPIGWTPLWEIVFDSNRIVVKYPFEGLVLLAMIDIDTGAEMSPKELQKWAKLNSMRCVEFFDKPLEECVSENTENEEGYVLSWPVNGGPNLKIKVKFKDYCTLHKLITQTNAVTVWEMLRDGLEIAKLTKDVPDEFKQWIKELEARFITEFHAIETEAWRLYNAYMEEKNAEDPAKKKAFALYATAQESNITPILFSMLSGKQYAPIIWKQIRPRGDDKPYKVDTEG